MTGLHSLSRLSDRDLVASLKSLVAKGRRLDAQVVRFIGEVDRRKLYREHACSSMFAFCTERLGMSEDVAFRRIRVARVARRMPVVLEHLASGRLHLSGLALLAPHLTLENVEEVLGRAGGRSKREIEALVRELAPLPDVAESIRMVAAPRPAAGQTDTDPAAPAPGRMDLPAVTPSLAPRIIEPVKPAAVKPLSPARYHVSFTASEALKNNLDKARELAGRGTTVESLFEEAMRDLVAKLEKKRFGVSRPATKSQREGGPAGEATLPANSKSAAAESAAASGGRQPKSRHIPKATRRAVWERDGGQCSYLDSSGHRCSERSGLEIDHIQSFALGGEVTVDNLRLRCGPHNRLHAERCFGPLFVQRAMAPPSKSGSP